MRTHNACRLRIYCDDTDAHQGQPFYRWLVEAAHRRGLRGATVMHGMMGFGGHSEIHSSKVFALAADLPVVIEIIDSREKIHDFVAEFEADLQKGLVTVEDVDTAFFAGNSD